MLVATFVPTMGSQSAPTARCSGMGTWNPAYARCVCAIGRSGEMCETVSLPSCRLRQSSIFTACTVRRPLSCSCLRECLDAGAFAPHFFKYCFERSRSNYSDVPMLNSPSARFLSFPAMKPVGAEVALAVPFRAHLRHVPHRYCSGRCSERGSCVADSTVAAKLVRGANVDPSNFHCECDPYYDGAMCERMVSPFCYNNCSGRGKCMDGYCLCDSPFFGPACAYSPSLMAKDHARSHFKVHVYDLDPIILRRATYGSDPDPIFNTYHTMMQHLLNDPRALAPSPEDADVFLVPAFGTNMDGLIEYYEHAYEQLVKRFPQVWGRRSGADHVWMSSADGGGCDLFNPRFLPMLQNSIVLAHYLKLNSSDGRCGVAARSVAVPPHVPPVTTEAFLSSGHAPFSSRRFELFFAGNVPDAHLVDSTDDGALANEAYSEGVRQLVWKYHRNRASYRIVARSPTYLRDWGSSKFCLAPLGVGWGVRLIWSIAGGCIPVLASSQVAPFFGDAIDYSTFALLGVPKNDLPLLHHTLSSFPSSAAERMHSAALDHRRLFLWDTAQGGGFAYNVTLHELCVRARWHPATSCAKLLPRAASRLIVPLHARGQHAEATPYVGSPRADRVEGRRGVRQKLRSG